jgi:hypothetical protein
MKKVLLAMFVLGMAATSQASIVLDTGRHGTETVNVTGLEIQRGALTVTTTNGGGFVLSAMTLQTVGISPLEMVNLLKKYNDSKSQLKITGVSILQFNDRYIQNVTLGF